MISLLYPEALLVGLLLVYVYWRHVHNKNIWRSAMVALAVFLLCYPAIRHSTRAMDVFFLVDRSRSINDQARATQQELIELSRRQLKPGDRLSVVSFNERAYIEQAPSGDVALQSFQIPYSEDASDLAEGIQTVLSLVDDKRRARVLVLSDGEFTGQDPTREAHLARQRKVPLYYRNLRRAEFFNITVGEADTPDQILATEPFRAKFSVLSSVATPGRYRIYRDGRIIGEQNEGGWRAYDFKVGRNEITFTDSLKNAGIHSYKIEVESVPRERENVLKDNIAETFVSVIGERPLLIVNNTGQPDNVAQILSAGGLKSHVLDIDNFHMDVNRLEGYKGLILNNVAILRLTVKQIEAMKRFVTETGGGLLVCGGNNSFGMGGYYKTALETILPVSLEDRKQSKKVATAFSIVLDRSGSMTMTTPSGKTKMALANHAAVESLNLMTGVDSLSVIAVDSAAHIMVEQQDLTEPAYVASRIRSIESMGGGIFTYTGLVAAGAQIARAPQVNKHILLFADAADAEEPGDYVNLLRKFEEVGITVSVVGLGTEADPDAAFLKDVAKRGKGQVYFTQDATQLVQFFTADTITYSRNTFIDVPAPMKVRSAAYTISPDQKWQDFTGSHYNLLFSKPKADIAIQTADSDNAPILAFWQQGLGRVGALALDPERTFTGNSNYGDVMLSTARWIMGSNVFDNLQIKSRSEGNYARVQMEVSEEEREKMGEAKLVLYSPEGRTITKPMQWDSHNRLSATTRLTESGCYRGVVQIGDKAYKAGPVSIPVSPEFMYDKGPDAGVRTLAAMAALTGGKEMLDLRGLFQRTQKTVVNTPVLLPFLIAFLVLLLLDIAEARFGMWAWARRRFQPVAATTRVQQTVAALKERAVRSGTTPYKRRRAASVKSAPETVSAMTQEVAPEAKKSAVPDPAAEDMDYLLKTKARAGQAMRKTQDPRDDRKQPG